MTDPSAAAETQLRNIEQATGMDVAAFATAAAAAGATGHREIIAFLKDRFGLSYGNANAVALRVRELAAGGPQPADALLDAQYAGGKAAMRPVHDRLVTIASGLGPDVTVLVQKTAVALRRKKQFGVITAASASRIALGLNLGATPEGGRVVATPGQMCSHRVDLADARAVDGEVEGFLREAYERAG